MKLSSTVSSPSTCSFNHISSKELSDDKATQVEDEIKQLSITEEADLKDSYAIEENIEEDLDKINPENQENTE